MDIGLRTSGITSIWENVPQATFAIPHHEPTIYLTCEILKGIWEMVKGNFWENTWRCENNQCRLQTISASYQATAPDVCKITMDSSYPEVQSTFKLANDVFSFAISDIAKNHNTTGHTDFRSFIKLSSVEEGSSINFNLKRDDLDPSVASLSLLLDKATLKGNCAVEDNSLNCKLYDSSSNKGAPGRDVKVDFSKESLQSGLEYYDLDIFTPLTLGLFRLPSLAQLTLFLDRAQGNFEVLGSFNDGGSNKKSSISATLSCQDRLAQCFGTVKANLEGNHRNIEELTLYSHRPKQAHQEHVAFRTTFDDRLFPTYRTHCDWKLEDELKETSCQGIAQFHIPANGYHASYKRISALSVQEMKALNVSRQNRVNEMCSVSDKESLQSACVMPSDNNPQRIIRLVHKTLGIMYRTFFVH